MNEHHHCQLTITLPITQSLLVILYGIIILFFYYVHISIHRILGVCYECIISIMSRGAKKDCALNIANENFLVLSLTHAKNNLQHYQPCGAISFLYKLYFFLRIF